ncbi:hypothetical protein [Methanosarcina horonobensis]|uniref:hypothetical protein n=1 Tax=Methanosarcina horonobensis TaxID=418008 RepID=UPI0022B92789|nr:hypothetical protein [Methanosarcina horonobensis]
MYGHHTTRQYHCCLSGRLHIWDLNSIYVRGAGLDIDPENYNRMISYEDIPYIASIEGVEKVILYDSSYLDPIIYTTAGEDRLRDKLNLIAVPESIAQDYLHQTAIPYRTEYLEEGSFLGTTPTKLQFQRNC